jgi:hypothetical protein
MRSSFRNDPFSSVKSGADSSSCGGSLKKTSRVLQQPPNFGIQTFPTFPLPPVPAVSQTGFARRKTKRKIHKNKNKKKTRSRKFHR